jgi:hypothetical protein
MPHALGTEGLNAPVVDEAAAPAVGDRAGRAVGTVQEHDGGVDVAGLLHVRLDQVRTECLYRHHVTEEEPRRSKSWIVMSRNGPLEVEM